MSDVFIVALWKEKKHINKYLFSNFMHLLEMIGVYIDETAVEDKR